LNLFLAGVSTTSPCPSAALFSPTDYGSGGA